MSDQKGSQGPGQESPTLEAQRPVRTGNLIVTLRDDVELDQQVDAIKKVTKVQPSVGSLSDLALGQEVHAGETILFKDFGVAVVAPAKGVEAASVSQNLNAADEIIEARPEYYLFALRSHFEDTATRTWGIAATGVENSPFTGRGIKVAVLDTGLDFGHHDFQHLQIFKQDFVTPGGSAHDGHGHGTHCAGTVCGQPVRADIPRYGVAPGIELHIGKVLSDGGSGTEQGILAGIAWAIDQGCHVISMSLGGTVRPGEAPNILYERIGQRALGLGSLIVAAAGNDSARVTGFIAPVNQPANSPAIMAVGAIDQAFDIAYFSNGGINLNGGAVDIAGPGVNVFSTTPLPRGYRTLGGTSMACPHVAGIAALWAESDKNLRGQALWDAVVKSARKISPLGPRDVGAGLVQAPQGSSGSAAIA